MTKKKFFSGAIIYFILILIAILCAAPFLWLLLSSLRTGANIYDLNFFNTKLTIDNYIGVTEFMDIPAVIKNTLIITIGSIVIDVVFSSLCAYPLATMEFAGKKVVFGILIATMIIPAAAGMIINYLTISNLKLLNSFWGVILPSSVKAFSIILLRQGYLGIPKELIDSACIDGANEFRIWWQIMVPGIIPAITTIIIFDFINSWNAFLWPMIVLQEPSKYPLATALQYLNGSLVYRFGYVAAGTIISILPVLLVFMIFQRNYIDAVSGAVKG